MAQTNLDPKELKDFLNHIISNNKVIQEQGKVPVAVEVVGDSGIGKTSIVLQVAQENNLDLVKLNLAQIEELGDLVGYPTKQYQLYREVIDDQGNRKKKGLWVDELAVDHYLKLNENWKLTGASKMSYAAPEWITNKKEGGILLLDDWNRGDSRFIQACMELIDRQTYISWSLPKNWHIILTSNPDNGDYLVNSIDNAQKTRYITANLKFDVKHWAEWAETAQIDGRCINFLLMHPELVNKNVNARSITAFFNSIKTFSNFNQRLPMIQLIGEGSVGEEFSNMFTTFINNKLDKLISPEKILLDSNDDYIIDTLKNTIGEGPEHRADIASILATRVANFAVHYSKNNSITDKVINRIVKLMETEELFSADLHYLLVRTIITGNKKKFERFLMNPKVVKYTLS